MCREQATGPQPHLTRTGEPLLKEMPREGHAPSLPWPSHRAGEAQRRPAPRSTALTPPYTPLHVQHAAAQHLRQPDIHVGWPELPRDLALGLHAAD